MTRIDAFRMWLSSKAEGETFTHKDVVRDFNIPGKTASMLIKDALKDIRDHPDGDRTRPFSRMAGKRTSRAVWVVGSQSRHVRNDIVSVADDVNTRVKAAVGDIDAKLAENPAARVACERLESVFKKQTEAYIESLQLLAA